MIHVFSYDNLKPEQQLYFELGLRFDARGQYEKAIEYFQLAYSSQTDVADVKAIEISIALGNAYLKQGAHTEAIKTFLDAAIQTDGKPSEYFEILLHEVTDELTANDYNVLAPWLEETWNPTLNTVLLSDEMKIALDLYHAKINFLTAQYQEAEHLLNEILRKSPANYRACRGLGELYFAQQSYPYAEDYFQKAFVGLHKESPQFGELTLALAKTYIADQKYELARKKIEELNSFLNTGLKTSILYLKTKAFFGMKAYSDANLLLDDLVQGDPRNMSYQIDRIVNHIALHDYSKALILIDQAFQIDPVNDELLFLKIECLIEGGLGIQEGVRLFSGSSFSYLKIKGATECEQRINTIRAQRPGDVDADFFITFIQLLIDGKFDRVNELVTKIQEVKPETNNEYPKLGLYILKADVSETAGKYEEAALNYLEAGKCYYWMGEFQKAEKYFRKVIPLHAKLTDAYNYLADTLYLLSPLTLPPYNDQQRIAEALQIWEQSPDKTVVDKNTAWYYVVIARIHEVMYKFKKENCLEEYWKSILYTERALIHDNTNTSYWTNLARYYRNLEVEENSRFVFDREAKYNEANAVFKEEQVMLQIDMGDFAEPEMYLHELEHKPSAEKEEIVYSLYHKAWKGFILFHQDISNLPEAIRLFDEVIRESNTELFAHQMKMFSHWQLHQVEEAKSVANYIKGLDKDNYPNEEFVFSWAAFIAGFVHDAITIMTQFTTRHGVTRSASFSLLQFYLYDGQVETADQYFEQFISFIYNKKVILELIRSLDQLQFQSSTDYAGDTERKQQIELKITTWKSLIKDRQQEVLMHPLDPVSELKNKQLEFQFKEGTIPYIAIQAGMARLLREKDLVASNKIYSSLRHYPNEFPEAEKMVENFWNELTNKGIDFSSEINPLVLEISQNLIPEGDSSRWSMFTRYIPELRTRINNEFGIMLGGVRIWPSDFLPDNTYIILLDEVPTIQGLIETEKLVVLEEEETLITMNISYLTSSLELKEKSLLWVDQQEKEQLMKEQVSFDEDYFSYMITHLEILLRKNLDMLVDTQFSDNYLSEYLEQHHTGSDEAIRSGINQLRSNYEWLKRFNQVLKGLLHEQVPLLSKELIIECFVQNVERLPEVNDLIQVIRIALKNELPGNNNNLVKIELPETIEHDLLKDLISTEGATFLSMSPDNCQVISSEIKSLVSQTIDAGQCIVVTNNARARIHLQKLLELTLPDVIVMSKEELITI